VASHLKNVAGENMQRKLCRICGAKLAKLNRTGVCFYHSLDKEADREGAKLKKVIGSTGGGNSEHTFLTDAGYNGYDN
jgi:hypothetical protein